MGVIEATFGEVEDEDTIPDIAPTEGETEEVPTEALTTKSSADQEPQPGSSGIATKRATRSSTKEPPVKKSRKQGKPNKSSGPFPIRDAAVVYPSKNDKAIYLHTGVPAEYIASRESGPHSRVVIYRCNFARVQREKGGNPEECDIMCQTKGQTSTHVRQFHLNTAIACYVCGHRWWSGFEWKKHMKSAHSGLTEEDWFVSPNPLVSSITVKKEISPEELAEEVKEEEDDDDDED